MLTNLQRDQGNAPSRPAIEEVEEEGRLILRLSGAWTTRNVAEVDASMNRLGGEPDGPIVLDLSGIERMDTAGAWLVDRLVQRASASGRKVYIQGQSASMEVLLSAIQEAAERAKPPEPERRPNFVIRALEGLGRLVYAGFQDFLGAMHILGATLRGGQMKLGRGHSINLAAIFHQIDRMGVGAIPVITLMSTIVGAIVAQQGAFQLRFFGAEIFVVDLVGILVLRELGVLLTAIMIAGRSGSAITAEIGSMKMREEVDALKVIGLNPIGVLVFPRLLALLIALPCLTILSDFAALAGAIFISWTYSGISPASFIDRLHVAIDTGTILAGLIKAPFMAIVIGVISSLEGLKVGGSAESLGLHVTASVVKSIFVVIILDGMFAIFFAQIGF
ncbi:MlaE family lipid ABC transporter permease subunit [Pseudaminobacter sp. 19-2017]|uniref:MlaE family lipid ABC transporter permease subunit n=1 Tax=Pseudaminobacter soli (ex Zhang et al. 2022) TaxID=2831468 RepID=A0A942DUG9_9HYPH|nr:MlaE family lipid ABC transporter permease subunit [Pseudaminobacter soli]MBS3647064.1 MlaE family lipid ABC transporter permease subunit [Pseudaminobacter soli]